MTSLAAVHTAAALVVRALGDAGVSSDVTLTFDATGIVVRPGRHCSTVDWATAVNAVAAETNANGSTLFCTGHVDTVPVTASWWLVEAVGA